LDRFFVHLLRHAKKIIKIIDGSQPNFLILRIKILQVTVLREFRIIKSLANVEDVLLLLSWKLLRWYKFNMLLVLLLQLLGRKQKKQQDDSAEIFWSPKTTKQLLRLGV